MPRAPSSKAQRRSNADDRSRSRLKAASRSRIRSAAIVIPGNCAFHKPCAVLNRRPSPRFLESRLRYARTSVSRLSRYIEGQADFIPDPTHQRKLVHLPVVRPSVASTS